MMTDLEPLIAAGQLLLQLGKIAEREGRSEKARFFYRRALLQGLLIRSLQNKQFPEARIENFWPVKPISFTSS